jgi:hypothetical protein
MKVGVRCEVILGLAHWQEDEHSFVWQAVDQ